MPNHFSARHIDACSLWARGLFIALLALIFVTPALAEKGKLKERLTPQVMAVVYPDGAERLGDEEGSPPAIPVYKGDKVVAYIFSTLDIIAAPGYSTTPFDVIGGIDTTGHITGAKVVFHQEPIIIDDPSRQGFLDTLLARQAGRALVGGKDPLPPDYVSGATISARAMRSALIATARLVLRPRLGRTTTTVAAADTGGGFIKKSLEDLVADGAVTKRRIMSGEVATVLASRGASDAKLDWPVGAPDDLYIEIFTALVNPEAIGGNLLGLAKLEEYTQALKPNQQAIFIASNGPYNFFGNKYTEASEGHRFDRIRLVQNGRTINFVESDYTYAVPAPGQQLAGLFALPPSFDPSKPWRLELLVNGTGARNVTVPFGVDYKVPDSYKPGATPPPSASAPATDTQTAQAQTAPEIDLGPELGDDLPPPVPAWVEAWSEARGNIVILAVLLTVLTLIFIFQARLARYRAAHRIVRTGFLMVTLIWLGWTAHVQLSTVNVINYVTGPFKHVDIGFYLAEPLLVIIAAYTLISVLLIARGVFCGWLCPFGALQELLAQVSRALHVPQWNPPVALEKRLWLGKYIAAVTVLFLVITAIDPAGATLEVEPFKTAITTKFTRAWPFVIYAGALLAIGLFSERAYCRFLCPLGGLLAILDRLHILNLLKRRPECGSPCHLCERACPVRAITPTGKIETAECFQCLDCQVEYYDDKRCPPLVAAAKLRGRTKPIGAVMKNV